MKVARCLCVAVTVATALMVMPMAVAQDDDLGPLLFLRSGAGLDARVDTSSTQAYRIPIGFTVRDPAEKALGLRLTLPVSVGFYRLDAATSVGDVFESLTTVTVTPGIEAHVALGKHWNLRPYGEIGVSAATSGEGSEVLYAGGVRSQGEYSWPRFELMLGASASYKSPRSDRSFIHDYSVVSVGADGQVPLGFDIGSRSARGGVYAVTRYFPDIDLDTGGLLDPLSVRYVHEVGLSFSTDPALRLWKIRLPWIGVGYRFGDLFSGVRINFSFPL
jgi:hypothetical protein